MFTAILLVGNFGACLVSSSSSSTLSVYNDIARSTISLQICLFCAIFSCSFTCIVLKLPSLLFFTNVLNSAFSKSFPICLIHVNLCPPLGFCRSVLLLLMTFLLECLLVILKDDHTMSIFFALQFGSMELNLSPYRVYHYWLCLTNLDSKFFSSVFFEMYQWSLRVVWLNSQSIIHSCMRIYFQCGF